MSFDSPFLQLSLDLCCVLGFTGTIQTTNGLWLTTLGYTTAELHGTQFIDLVHPEDRKQTELELARQTPRSFTNRCRTNDGEYRRLHWRTMASLSDRKVYAIGRPESLTITRSERLMALGQIALGVVHDLKNIVLHPVSLQLQRIERALESQSPERARTAIASAREVLRESGDAIDRLLHFGQRKDRELAPDIDLDTIAWRATEIAGAYARSLVENDDVKFDWQPGAPRRIDADSFDLLAALVNIMFNAVDAVVGHRGTVTVKTGDEGSRVWLTISDNGPGMAAEVRDRVFEPFFTTKPHGVGLGLSMVKTCVDRHRGAIRVITAPGAGTTVRIELPAT